MNLIIHKFFKTIFASKFVIKMTTEDNLRAAFAGESQARNKYDYFAKVAEKEGYGYIANIFRETAMNEHQHAKEEFKKLGGIGSTADNLRAAMNGEAYEVSDMYPKFAEEARAEGKEDVALLFEEIAKVEEEHRKRFERLLKLVEDGKVFERNEEISWKCEKCGHIHVGQEAPKVCPCCKHPQSYFEPVE